MQRMKYCDTTIALNIGTTVSNVKLTVFSNKIFPDITMNFGQLYLTFVGSQKSGHSDNNGQKQVLIA